MELRSIGLKGFKAGVVAMAAAITLGGGQAAHAASGVVGPHRTPIVGCDGGRQISVQPPMVKAVNKTSKTDKQWVAFQPTLRRSNGSAWVETSSGMVYYGIASDSASPTQWVDQFGNPVDPKTIFLATDYGQYKVTIKFWWFTGNTVTGSDHLYSSSYVSPIGAVLPYCTI